MSVGLTMHGYERSKERINVKGKKVLRYAKLAYERGIHYYNAYDIDLSNGIYEHTRQDGETEVVIYDCCYWVFGKNGNLITVFGVEDNVKRAYEKYNHKLNQLIA